MHGPCWVALIGGGGVCIIERFIKPKHESNINAKIDVTTIIDQGGGALIHCRELQPSTRLVGCQPSHEGTSNPD